MAALAHHSLRGLRVLLVEDEALILLMTAEMLRELGCDLFGTASTIDEARSLVRDSLPDVAVLDVNLRGEMSFGLAEFLHERNVPILFLTGYDTPGTEHVWQRFLRLHKPCDLADLELALLSVLGLASRNG
jgi:DNA-binding response OmpR family regulator